MFGKLTHLVFSGVGFKDRAGFFLPQLLEHLVDLRSLMLQKCGMKGENLVDLLTFI